MDLVIPLLAHSYMVHVELAGAEEVGVSGLGDLPSGERMMEWFETVNVQKDKEDMTAMREAAVAGGQGVVAGEGWEGHRSR